MKHNIYILVAADKNNGIGKAGKLPWHLTEDMTFFLNTTSEVFKDGKQNMVVMGRKTWESIPKKFRPLKNRQNVILTRQAHFNAPGAITKASLDQAFKIADDDIENIFIIGGAQVFAEALRNPRLTGIYLTKINHTYDCDTFLPEMPQTFINTENLGTGEEKGVSYSFLYYSKPEP